MEIRWPFLTEISACAGPAGFVLSTPRRFRKYPDSLLPPTSICSPSGPRMSSPARTIISPAAMRAAARDTSRRAREWDELRAAPLHAIVDSEQRLIEER